MSPLAVLPYCAWTKYARTQRCSKLTKIGCMMIPFFPASCWLPTGKKMNASANCACMCARPRKNQPFEGEKYCTVCQSWGAAASLVPLCATSRSSSTNHHAKRQHKWLPRCVLFGQFTRTLISFSATVIRWTGGGGDFRAIVSWRAERN